ncbi:hypothetical protein [Streptomyces sp. NRRL S-646]|uniref:hypothetical protein n=1 Tax=Streptomyces sp. NRRL S-646 TaxID=1463917 RepID=UPI0004C7C28C|nr:hypothetical protein [Streptomyces sp. NRRL S-646]
MSRPPHRRHRPRPTRAGDAWLAIAPALLALLVVGVTGCSKSDVRSGAPPLKLCGVTFWSGAEGIGTTQLSTSTRGMPSAPAADRLPATTARDSGGPPPRVVSVSSDCSHGRTVVVSPASSVRVRKVAKDGGGHVVALSLVPAQPGTPAEVHIYAYDGTRPTGQLLTMVG